MSLRRNILAFCLASSIPLYGMDFSSSNTSDLYTFFYNYLHAEHPYIKTIKTLKGVHKTVRQFIKEQHKIREREIINEIKKEFNLAEEDLAYIDKIFADYKKNILPKQICTITFTDDFNNNENQELRDTITEIIKLCKLKEPIKVVLDDTIKGPFSAEMVTSLTLKSEDPIDLPSIENIEHILKLGKTFTSSDEKKAILIHEFSHAKKLHLTKRSLLVTLINLKKGIDKRHIETSLSYRKLMHFQEYQADQHVAKNDAKIAQDMETMCYNQSTRHFLRIDSYFDAYSHPSTQSRYKSVQYIRQLLETEQNIDIKKTRKK